MLYTSQGNHIIYWTTHEYYIRNDASYINNNLHPEQQSHKRNNQ